MLCHANAFKYIRKLYFCLKNEKNIVVRSLAPGNWHQSKLYDNDSQKVHAPSFYSIKPCKCVRSGLAEKLIFGAFIGVLWLLDRIGLLSPMLKLPIKQWVRKGALGDPFPSLAIATHKHVVLIIRDVLYLKKSKSQWKKLTNSYIKDIVQNGNYTPITDPRFKTQMENIIGASFSEHNKLKLLSDGPAAFGKRYRLLDKNPKRVYVSSFRIETDATGEKLANKLSELALEGADVRVMVDKKIASRQPNHSTLHKMEAAGVKVAYWADSQNPLYGLHAKIFVSDDQAIIGGTNYGDCYSHSFGVKERVPALPNYKWRDTDVLVKGSAVQDSINAFAKLWNNCIDNPLLKMDPLAKSQIDYLDQREKLRTPPEIKALEEKLNIYPRIKVHDTEVAVVLHQPEKIPEREPNTLGMLKLISGAQHQIDIENAYYIRMPFFSQALLCAINRGVKVRILTNSEKSLDEVSIASPILESLHELVANGAEIYLKKGDTLHSKFMQVDNQYSYIGSYNINPRSVMYDCEMGYFVKSERFAKGINTLFEHDISVENAIHIKKITDIPKISTFTSRFLEKYFYDHT